MSRFLTQIAKVTSVNLLGFVLYFIYSFLLTVGSYILALLIAGVVSLGAYGTSLTHHISPILIEELSVVAIIFIVLTILVISFIQSIGAAFVIGGLYGSTSDVVFTDTFSLKEYFYHSARNTWRLTLWQWTLFLLILPILILFVFFSNPYLIPFPQQAVIGPSVFFALLILFCYVFQYTPLLIVRYRAKVWQSFGWSFRLIKRRFVSTVLGFLLFTIPNLLIQLLYITIAVGLVTVVHFLSFSSSINVTLQVIIGILVFLFWIVIFVPFTITCFIMLSIRHYRRHLEDALPEATMNRTEQEPFTLKMLE